MCLIAPLKLGPFRIIGAVVTLVNKIFKPSILSDFTTQILSRTAEKIIVSKWLRPNIPRETQEDQFGFSLLTFFQHHVVC